MWSPISTTAEDYGSGVRTRIRYGRLSVHYVFKPLTGLVFCSDCDRLNRIAGVHEPQPENYSIERARHWGMLRSALFCNGRCEG
jgi:hypothetical protein